MDQCALDHGAAEGDEVRTSSRCGQQTSPLSSKIQNAGQLYLIKDPDMRKDFGFESTRQAKRAVKDLESLRNNLAHVQDILTHDWATIVTIATRLNKVMTRI